MKVSNGFLAASLIVLSGTVSADAIDINLRDTAAQLQYIAPMAGSTLGKADFHAGVVYTQNTNMLGDIGLLVKDDIGGNAPGVSAGVGVKLVAARVTTARLNASALTVGGMLRYSPPSERRLGVVGEVYLSPTILTFGHATHYLESNVRVEYEVIPQALAYLSYRKMEFNMKLLGSTTFDQGFNLGMKLAF
jgi:YfaZ precursor